MAKLSNYQLILMGTNFFTTVFIISLPSQIIATSRQDAWLSYLPAFLIMVIPLWMLSKVMHRFPDQDLFSVLKSRFPIVGSMLTSFYLLFFFFILIRDFRMFIDFISVALLQRTPLTVIGGLVILTCILSARSGVQVVARMHELFYPLLMLITVILPFLFYAGTDIRWMQPVLAQGVKPVLHGSWLAVSYIGEIIILPFIVSNRTFQLKQGLISLLIGAYMLEMLVVLNLLVLSPNLASRMMYPNYELAREVRVTEFLDRFDSILVTFWLPALFQKISLMLNVICHGIKQMMPGVQERSLSTSLGILAFVCGFWFFENPLQLLNLNGGWPAVALIFEILLPLCFYFMLKPRFHR
ncbi:MAG: hypothetical protein JWN30_435 [Bacilli bacterium]|nr:hypothetical protein [Bacilli bacterium]